MGTFPQLGVTQSKMAAVKMLVRTSVRFGPFCPKRTVFTGKFNDTQNSMKHCMSLLGGFVAATGVCWMLLARKSGFASVKAKSKEKESSDSCVVCDLSGIAGVHTVPPLTLYQYQTCPFCSKVRAFLDYYGLEYTKVEVNPLFKKELKFTSYKKVPFVVADDIEVADSSLIISALQSCMVGTGTVEETLTLYPQIAFTDEKGRDQVERANKYFIMFGNTKQIDERREERQWRQWVDDRFVHTLAPNIYRTLSEAMHAMDYISTVGNFSRFEQVAAKYAGAAAMCFLGRRLKKKYQLKADVRQSLYDGANEWMEAVGPNRPFLGGDRPNLADLAMYGVLSAIEGLPAFTDMTRHTGIAPWYSAVKREVTEHRGKREEALEPAS